MKALVGAFNQEKALVGAFSVIVQPVVEPMEHCTALRHQDPPQEVENFHTDFTITEKASTEAFYVIMKFQTSRRFV